MADNLQSRVLDLGLNVLDTEADRIYICSAEPTTFTEATSTYALGNKTFSAGAAVGSPAAGSPNGRKVTTSAITDGSVTATGNASKIGIVDFANSRLLAVLSISNAQTVTSGNTFSLPALDIRIPSQ
jgi:hypothetical protein